MDAFIKQLQEIFNECLAIARKKNADYATDADPYKNFRNAQLLGVSVEKAILVRISDKMARISNILDKGGKTEVEDESIYQTCIDALNYFAILASYVKSTHRVSESV